MANSANSSCSNFKDLLLSHSQARQENGQYLSESASSDLPSREPPVPNLSRLLRGKELEWEAVKAKPRPLQLLDLPVDILRLIVKEVTNTNDLTSLALTNSILYYLTVPYIYTRFDIVWPDDTSTTSDTKNVDALTYGLSTLCLGSKFAQRKRWLQGSSPGTSKSSQRLADNHYAKYTRKFSLGNGPKDWTSEYEVTKESGKMLGTLVAIAVGKMVNLETFVWDMPTGVLSEVFMALASLQDHYPEGESKLDKVWVRWHDNSDASDPPSSISTPMQPPPMVIPPVGSTATPVGYTLPSDFQPSALRPIKYSESHVEYPTFSVLPSLKSLTVLDIDELAYLDEMSVLIQHSRFRLRELRVGISSKARSADFAQPWDAQVLQQVDHDAQWHGENRIGEKRLGGVLGILVGRIYDIRRKPAPKLQEEESAEPAADQDPIPEFDGVEEFGSPSSSSPAIPVTHMDDASVPGDAHLQDRPQHDTATASDPSNGEVCVEGKRLNGKLQLETLELERVPLSLQVCIKAFDWSVLTSLTVLDCMFVNSLWRALKRQFHPTPAPHGSPPGTPSQYHLSLKHIHTDMTSNTLIGFIKETLAPNSLEVLFLQDRHRTLEAVRLHHIFVGAIKRNRLSLKKLLLDSSHKSGDGRRWLTWMLSSEMVSYITSGRMPNLRELSVALDYQNWHPFLQRLPNIPQLRSLHVTHILELEHFSGNFESKELALQLVDIITLRPEIQLCYVGIGSKCFEILETRPSDGSSSDASANGDQHSNSAIVIHMDDDNENEGSEDDEETEDDDDDVNDDSANGNLMDAADDLTDASDAESETESVQEGDLIQSAARLRLREILFYDDKIAIFKARHGRL